MAMTRRTFLAAAMAAVVGTAGTARAAPSGRPNVLVILVDDLGYGDLACYGAKDMRTPHLDALMASGMRFDNFYANCPVCSPTRAALLTGRYPDVVGVPGVIRTFWDNNWGNLAEDAVLLPSLLREEGYRCALVGKWHLGLEAPDTPTTRGFDFCHGWLGDMMDDYYEHRRHGINYMVKNDALIDPEGHATDLFTDWACDYITERADQPEPFFLYLAYNAPHTPIQPPQDWLDKVKARETGIDSDRAALVALIEHMDDGIGRVMACLEASGQAENTLVIFTSDNGGQSNRGANNGDLRGGKTDMYEGGIRVPMCAVWPGHIEAGTRSDRVALTMDIFPTACEAAAMRPPSIIEGRSFLSTLRGEDQAPDDRTLFWMRREGGAYGGQDYYAARKGPWKLLQNSPFEMFSLYNLDEDPLEANPYSVEHPMYQELFAAIRERVARAGQVPWQRLGEV